MGKFEYDKGELINPTSLPKAMNTTMDLNKPEETKEEAPKEAVQKPKKEIVLPENLQKKLSEAANVEDKAEILMSHVEHSLGHTPPKFKDFWDGRSTLLDLLKEVTAPTARNDLWEKLSLLTQEARRKKDELIKESAFAEEQIEKAISSLEKEIDENAPQNDSPKELFNHGLEIFKENHAFYQTTQATLNLLNAFASQINALRKELIKTSLRIRTKNQFFDRLSQAGNKVFPKRKELIQAISSKFTEDVHLFVEDTKEQLNRSPHLLTMRQEIQELQKLAKTFTLNTYSFNETRKELSSLWDKMKVQEKEKKKEHAQYKEESKSLMEPILEEIDQVEQQFNENEISIRQAEEILSQHLSKMRRVRLDRGHVKQLKQRILDIKKPIDEKLEEEARAFEEREKKKEEERKALYTAYEAEVVGFTQEIKTLELAVIEERTQELKDKKGDLQLSTHEKKEIDKLFKEIKLQLAEKKEEALLNLPEEDRQYLQNLKQVLEQRVERRNEIRENLDRLRALKNKTGLDFAQAFTIDEQVKEEKDLLDKVNEGISEIEAKIANIS